MPKRSTPRIRPEEGTLSTSAREAERVAIYPGAFDPVHLGHLDIARRSAALFDRLVIGVYHRPNKALTFSLEERIDFFRRGVADLPNVEVASYEGLTINLACRRGARFVVRGLRTTTDFDYEYRLTMMNGHLAPGLETVFLMTAPGLAFHSSSLIKEVAAEGAPLDGLVTEPVARALRCRFQMRD